MITLKFKCTLLSDVVLNTKAATEGEQTTLDFIPGNNFLGIVASKYDSFTPAEQMEIFHSGKVRFGDAHPVCADASIRSLHIPATLFYPKGKKASEECYASQSYDRKKDVSYNGHPMQLKQCRKGYYIFDKGEAQEIEVKKSFSLKSAYDRIQRRSKDAQMYGYESLDKGQVFFFEVEIENNALSGRIEQLLVGTHRIGRSRTAQYGLAKIEKAEFSDVESSAKLVDTKNGKRVAVYADSRLIFLDNMGQPILQPTAEQLGLSGSIDWNISQVRTFQYAPWNGKRQTRDADRYGIEKGSVYFVNTTDVPSKSQYIGNYKNEGFGRVIYNPDFLRASEKDENGKALYHITETENANSQSDKDSTKTPNVATPLLNYLSVRKKDDEAMGNIAMKVNEFVDNYKNLFRDKEFASQWGAIRKIAMACHTCNEINYELFDKTITKYGKSVPNAYLTHGIAKDKWEERGRRDKLKKFIDKVEEKIGADYVQMAVVNLASEMAKATTNKKKDGNN